VRDKCNSSSDKKVLCAKCPGVKWLKVEADENLLSPAQGYLIRKVRMVVQMPYESCTPLNHTIHCMAQAPGSDLFDYGQTIFFDKERQVGSKSPRNSSAASSPKQSGGAWVSRSRFSNANGASQSGAEVMTLNDSAASENIMFQSVDESDYDELLGNTRSNSEEVIFDPETNFADLNWPLLEVSEAPQQYVTPLFPTGCMFRFKLLSTCGDVHYIGLNGLEMFDENNELIPLTKKNLEVCTHANCGACAVCSTFKSFPLFFRLPQ